MATPSPSRPGPALGAAPAQDREPPAGAGSHPPALRTLIIGYGSPIRGDDAIGPLAADALASGSLPAGVQVMARHELTAELTEDLAAADRVIFLDAAIDGVPGEVRVQALHPDASDASTMAHFQSPRELLAWCDALYARVPRAWLVTVAGLSFDYAHCSLSPPARAALGPMLEQVWALLSDGSEPRDPADIEPQGSQGHAPWDGAPPYPTAEGFPELALSLGPNSGPENRPTDGGGETDDH